MLRQVKILFIEDSANDVELVTRVLEKAGYDPDAAVVETSDTLKTALKNQTWDLIFSDYNLPELNGSEALEIAKAFAPEVPFIVVSGAIGEERAVDLMRSGARDFVSKTNLKRLLPIVERELHSYRQKLEAQNKISETEENLRKALAQVANERENFRNLFRQTPEMICILHGPEHTFEFVNEAHIKALGFDATGMKVRVAQPESVEVHGILDKVYQTGETAFLHEIPVTVTNRLRYFNLTYSARRDENGLINGIMILGLEVTEAVELRRQIIESQKRYQRLFDFSPVPLWIADIETLKFMDVNDAAIKHYGYSKEEFLGMTLKDIRPSEEIPHLMELMGRAYTGDENSIVHVRHQKKDGTTVMAEISALDLVLDGKKARMGAIIDVTQNLNLIQRLQESKAETENILRSFQEKSALLETIVEQIPLSVTFAEAPSGKLLKTNSKFIEVWGEPIKRLNSINEYEEYVGYREDGSQYEPDEWPLARAISKGELVINEDVWYDRPDGKRVVLRLTATPVRDSDGKIVAGVLLTEDVTAQKHYEQEIKKAKEAAEAANLAKTRFLANMSHEIRTPLGAIMGFVDLMKQPDTDREDAKNFLSVISRNSDQLLRIIDDILDLSKVEAGMIQIENINFSLTNLLSDFSSLMGVRARDRAIKFQTRSLTVIPDLINSDPVRLKQILTNVVGNALKFTEKGHVDVCVSYEEPYLYFKVADTGPGISDEEKKRIFQPFSQADVSTTRRFGGTGLGLVLTKKLAQALGGDFWLEDSQPGKGSVFIAKVKVTVPENSKFVSSDALAFANGDFNQEEVPSEVVSHGKILVVEDAPDNQKLIQIFLKKAGYEVAIASDGRKGVEKAMGEQFDIVLMDIQMPYMDGHEATKTLRAKGYQKPIIALTAHAMKEERELTKISGFTDFLSKPIQKDLLLDILSKYS